MAETQIVETQIQQLIDRLGLMPHPEGGFYRERHRSSLRVRRADGSERAAFTVIDFLLPAGVTSRWHRLIGAEESWHHVGGAALILWRGEAKLATPSTSEALALRLGPLDLDHPDQFPVQIIEPGCWQAARSLGDWSLVNCCVAPGFEFTDFVCPEVQKRSTL